MSISKKNRIRKKTRKNERLKKIPLSKNWATTIKQLLTQMRPTLEFPTTARRKKVKHAAVASILTKLI